MANTVCLTQSQKESFDFIQQFYKDNGHLPTMSEVAEDANCTVPGIAYRVAASFLKGAFGHNANNERHIITEPMVQVVGPAVKFEDIFESFCDREYLKNRIFNCLSYAYDYTPRELFEGRKNGPWGGPLTSCMKSALEKSHSARKDAAFLVLDCIDELVAEGKIEHYRCTPSQPREHRWHTKAWSHYDFKTHAEYEANAEAVRIANEKAYEEEQARLAEEARLEAERVAEEAAKQNDTNAALAKAFVALLSDPAIGKIVSSITGFNAQ